MAFPVLDVTQPSTNSPTVAAGDGVTDDTQAFQERLDEASSNNGGEIYIPAGTYRITQTLHKPNLQPVTIRGSGFSTTLNWEFNSDLFVWDNDCVETTISDFRIISTANDMDRSAAAFNLTTGVSVLLISRIEIDVDDPQQKRFGTGIRLAVPGVNPGESLGGEIRLEDLFIWRYKGTAIELRDVTDVRIRGCRLPAIGMTPGSIGLHLAGNTGGVWMQDTDISEPDHCILVEKTGQRKWNRELFITGGACDAANHGLVIRDNTFVTSTGAWYASCNSEQILVEEVEPGPEGKGPRMEITGGIVFNGGSLSSGQEYDNHGLVINSGHVALTGVNIENNAGIGLIIGDAVEGYTVNACTFLNNWEYGADLGGKCGAVTGNVFRQNGEVLDLSFWLKLFQFVIVILPLFLLPKKQFLVRGEDITSENNQVCEPRTA